MKTHSSKHLSFLFTPDSIDRILRRPDRLDYKGLAIIIDYTGKSSSMAMKELHKKANALYKQRRYDKCSAVDKKAEIKAFLAENPEHLDAGMETLDESSPEGLGVDEIDWESYDYE